MSNDTPRNDSNSPENVLQFNSSRRPTRARRDTATVQRSVAAVVTVTRFIGNEKVHAQVPVFADQINATGMTAADLRLAPELSELLADGAVEANSYLDRLSATRAARPLRDYYSSLKS